MGNEAKRETPTRLENEALRALATLLPPDWELDAQPAPADRTAGGQWCVRAPDGRSTTLLLDAKAGQLPSSDAVIAPLLWRARSAGLAPLLVVPYAGPGLRRACEDNGVNYLDLTGWASIQTNSPGLVVRVTGATRDPRPARPATINRLSGRGAGRVLRALIAGRDPIGVRELAARASVAPGTVSKVLKALATEGVLERGSTGQVRVVAKRALVDRWTRDYQFLRLNSVSWCLAARGLPSVLDRAIESGQSAVATGSVALRRYLPAGRTPVTPLSQLALYVPDTAAASGQLGLVPVDRVSANVILAEPYDPQLLVGGRFRPEVPVVDIGQTIADLLTMPGRGPEEADQLMDLLAETDAAWS